MFWSNPQIKIIAEVLHEIEEIAEYMQMCIRDYENVQKLLEIQDKVWLHSHSRWFLLLLQITIPGGVVVPGRRFIYEGTLFHVSFS